VTQVRPILTARATAELGAHRAHQGLTISVVVAPNIGAVAGAALLSLGPVERALVVVSAIRDGQRTSEEIQSVECRLLRPLPLQRPLPLPQGLIPWIVLHGLMMSQRPIVNQLVRR